MFYHVIASLPGGRKKSIVNKTEEFVFSQIVLPFVSTNVVSAKWGKSTQTYQVVELYIYKSEEAWYKKGSGSLEGFLKGKKNIASKLIEKAKRTLSVSAHRVFVIMPIQGEKYGDQEQQRIHQEYDKRFQVLEKSLSKMGCVAIRIDKEHPLDDLVKRIKEEILKAKFLIADLTDERPSCYFEAGYAEAIKRPIIYIASNQSVMHTGQPTIIHFDVHMNVNRFSNHTELAEKVEASISRNKGILFKTEDTAVVTDIT